MSVLVELFRHSNWATLRLIDGLDGVSGRYFNGQRESRADAQAYDRAARKRLRELSDDLVRRALG